MAAEPLAQVAAQYIMHGDMQIQLVDSDVEMKACGMAQALG